jgi:hypothetical protein
VAGPSDVPGRTRGVESSVGEPTRSEQRLGHDGHPRRPAPKCAQRSENCSTIPASQGPHAVRIWPSDGSLKSLGVEAARRGVHSLERRPSIAASRSHSTDTRRTNGGQDTAKRHRLVARNRWRLDILGPAAIPALVAQGIERRTPKPGVASSNLAGGTPKRPYLLGCDRFFSTCRQRSEESAALPGLAG